MSLPFLLDNASLEARQRMNDLGRRGTPFLFVFDYAGRQPIVRELDELDGILYDFKGVRNTPRRYPETEPSLRDIQPVDFPVYKQAFDLVQQAEQDGESYLINLTFPSRVSLNTSLKETFHAVGGSYRLYLPGRFLSFSPETFVTIQDGLISSHPMKGTIDCSVPRARQVLLENEKEAAEHVTIVDLIRNDLGMIAYDVKVEDFRYVERVTARERSLLQVSSQITGRLPEDYPQRIGDIITSLLPAGSITGAPKKRTMEIIARAEADKRGYYTGVAGLFDGRNLDSCVLIRFIEQTPEGFLYRSGGGITVYSEANVEYNELKEKIYVPLC